MDWRERLAEVLAVLVVLLAGASLAAGIRNALFDAAPLRAGTFSATDVADLVAPVEDEAAAEPEAPSSTTSTTETTVAGPSTTSTSVRSGTATTTTTIRPVTVTTAAVVTTTTSSPTTTTTEAARGRSDENRGRGKPADD